jgi:Na+-transporting methylmalonyl-CoA/oxaloacetate decarboxylase beta subunit
MMMDESMMEQPQMMDDSMMMEQPKMEQPKMEQPKMEQPKMMEKKGKMEMPMTGGPSLGLLLLPAAALLVGMSLMAGYVVRRRK